MAVRKPAADPAHEETEKLIKQMEKRISKEYAQAEKEVQVKIDDYFDRFRLKDEKWREWVADGKKTAAEYKKWRVGQMAVGKRWESLKQTVAEDFAHTDQIARSIVKGYMPEVYATNFNYGTYEVEVGAKVDTSFTLYDRQTVERIMRDNPDLLPAPGKKVSKDIAEGKAVRWNKQLIQSVMTQGILQGESIPNLATRLAKDVGDSDRKAAIRNARTMATGAQNAGRVDSYKRAEGMGINMEQEWRATLDMRTRHEHRQLDGQRQKVGDPFKVDGYEILFPGDPSAEGFLIYNCRCTLRGVVAGLEPQARKYRDDSAIAGMTYDEWKKAKASQKAKAVTAPSDITTRQQALDALSSVFGSVESNVKVIPDELLIENVNQLMKLNERFGALTDNNTGYFTTSPSKTSKKALAWTSTQYRKNGSTNLSLVGKAFKDAKTVEDGFKKYRDSLWYMPADDKYAHTYYVTHEYGHILESFISRKRTTWGGILGDDYVNDPKKEEKKQAKKIAKEIIQIAKDNNHDFVFADNISQYGCTNDYEFFAEVFANSQCGKPNELGLAMQKWLKQEGF